MCSYSFKFEKRKKSTHIPFPLPSLTTKSNIKGKYRSGTMMDPRLRQTSTNPSLTGFQFCDFEQIIYKISSSHRTKWQH